MNSTETIRTYTGRLKSILSGLLQQYGEARSLLEEQIQAVVSHDADRLDLLVEQQLNSYKVLEKKEQELKSCLEAACQSINTDVEQPALTPLLEKLPASFNGLRRLRDDLHRAVTQTRDKRIQLVNLLRFARSQNEEAFEEVFRLGNNSAESYGSDGKRKQGAVRSLSINRKA